jgi:hypothetical protein
MSALGFEIDSIEKLVPQLLLQAGSSKHQAARESTVVHSH